MQQPAAPPSWRLDRERFAAHAYFEVAVPETQHSLTDAAQAACEGDPELSPGLDCCAVCARAAPPLRSKPAGKAKSGGKGGEQAAAKLLKCNACHRVVYCCREHQQEDRPCHSQVCQLLAMIQSTDAVEVPPPRQEQLIDMFPTSCQELPPALKDWCGVVPSHFANVWRRRKKSEKQQAEAAAAPQGKPGASNRVAPAAAPPSPDSFPLVAELAVASSLLSYPLTLLACLGAGPPRQQQGAGSTAAPAPAASTGGPRLRWAVPGSRPLVVCVLGASEAAELAQPQVWQVLDGFHPGGVCLQFVGPEVPAAMHATTMTTGASKGVTMTFFKGEYDKLARQVQPAGSSGGAPLPAGAAKAKGPEGKRAAGSKQPSGSGSASALPPALLLPPDVVLGFNMGLTCPDYDWLPTLRALKRISGAKRGGEAPSSPAPAPLRLVATCNTFVEAAMEDEVLQEEGGCSVERAVRANPFVCLELMQSGTLGNDVYRKNAWVAVYELQAKKPKAQELGKPGLKSKGGGGGAQGDRKRGAQNGPGTKGGARQGAGGHKKQRR